MDDNTEVVRGKDGSWNPLGFGQAFSTPEGSTQQYGFTNNYAPSPQAKALGTVIEILNDPRNSWMGLGPLAGVVKGPGWGAEALRRYKLMGGTPETLNHTLKMRAFNPEDRRYITKHFRESTDLAAPPNDAGLRPPQATTMDIAGTVYEQYNRGGRPNTRFGRGPAQDITMHRPGEPSMESASAANAAYGAVSRQVARMLDTPGFQFSKAQDLPSAPVLEEVDIPSKLRSAFRHDELSTRRPVDFSSREHPNRRAGDYMPGAGATLNRWPDNRQQYTGPERRGSRVPEHVEALLDDWIRDERDLTPGELRLLNQHYPGENYTNTSGGGLRRSD